jgi:hypothetical protein
MPSVLLKMRNSLVANCKTLLRNKKMMKKIVLGVMSSLLLTACASTNPYAEQLSMSKAAMGGGIGAAAGAAIGAGFGGNDLANAGLGALAGGAVGAAVGAYMDHQQKMQQQQQQGGWYQNSTPYGYNR